MCVLQARQAHEKYEGSYESIAKTIKTFVSPKHKKKALRDFFKMMVINTLVQNGDAHLKNFGLLYENIQNIWLAPAYDVVCTTVYIQKDIPALHLLGSKKWWSKAFLIRFGKENCELSSSEISILYDECIVAMRTIVIDIKERIEREHDSDVKMFLSALERVFEKSIE
jgi:serine/threonine-protein kinase HipA